MGNEYRFQNEQFIVERSLDGSNFQEIEVLESISESTHHMNYQTRDSNAQIGINYYRLKQIFNDGTFQYSVIREVAFDLDVEKFVIFPNPTSKHVFINLQDFVGNIGSLHLYNSIGHTVLSQDLGVISSQPVRLSVEHLPPGVYAISVQVADKKIMTELLVITKL